MSDLTLKMGDALELDRAENKVDDTNPANTVEVTLDARKTLSGNIAIYNHEDVDIVIDVAKSKIVVFAKDELNDMVYDTQSRMFDFLSKKGIVDRSSVQAGSVYGSMQADIEKPPEDNGIDPVQVAVLGITKFIEEEAPRFMYQKMYDEQEEKQLTDPDSENSTELGEVPHKREKGSMRPGIYRNAYMHNRYYKA
ncbi:MAG: hypothetical protein CMQ51_05620 [Gammaproteobacteria bacterium]|nr:hypothetical protein [Gammaproteobacteria bacterium]|tara:strand:+ start:7165 stop:7749 length:585 start_codon:yes stop_codon:yes gene_type:complete